MPLVIGGLWEKPELLIAFLSQLYSHYFDSLIIERGGKKKGINMGGPGRQQRQTECKSKAFRERSLGGTILSEAPASPGFSFLICEMGVG